MYVVMPLLVIAESGMLHVVTMYNIIYGMTLFTE